MRTWSSIFKTILLKFSKNFNLSPCVPKKLFLIWAFPGLNPNFLSAMFRGPKSPSGHDNSLREFWNFLQSQKPQSSPRTTFMKWLPIFKAIQLKLPPQKWEAHLVILDRWVRVHKILSKNKTPRVIWVNSSFSWW